MLGAVVLEHAAQVAHAREQQQVAEEDAVRRTPSTSQNSNEEPSWSLIRLVSRRDQEEQDDRERERDDDRPAHTPRGISCARGAAQYLPAVLLALALLGRQLRVGRDLERAEADHQRAPERDDAARRSAGAARDGVAAPTQREGR